MRFVSAGIACHITGWQGRGRCTCWCVVDCDWCARLHPAPRTGGRFSEPSFGGPLLRPGSGHLWRLEVADCGQGRGCPCHALTTGRVVDAGRGRASEVHTRAPQFPRRRSGRRALGTRCFISRVDAALLQRNYRSAFTSFCGCKQPFPKNSKKLVGGVKRWCFSSGVSHLCLSNDHVRAQGQAVITTTL